MWSASVCAFIPRADWASLGSAIRSRYPEVRHITTSELAVRLAGQSPILLDVRTADEFAISHLPGARHAPNDSAVRTLLKGIEADQSIVVYCAVGYRSARTTDLLRRLGYVNAINLEGSIFAWANEGRPIVRGQQRVNEVHPYNEHWGKLLDRGRWASQWRAQ
ncbi:MAG: rhodanese-like domain-containing protein [Burkholderiales bacterium]